MSGQRQTLPPLAALKPGDQETETLGTQEKRNAAGIARQRRRQRLPSAREPDLQARLLELASGDRSCHRRRGRRWPGGGRGWCRGRRCDGTLAERLFLRRFLRALLLVGLDLRLDRSEGLLVVFL